MELYFSPLACSLATRITLYEASADATYTEVDPKTKRTSTGQDFYELNPLGLVPTLRTDEGELLTENAAILQYVADRHPAAGLAPHDGLDRVRLQQWLCFIGTELHKPLFVPLLDDKAPQGAKDYALTKGKAKLDLLQRHLQDREWLLDSFSVADAYLCAILNWTAVTPVKLADWPAVAAYHARLHARPHVARAFGEELTLYKQHR
ncbi:MAG TPA: glutathione binding-like protein [Polyangiales bacterium]|nr:glutathione binding-like protein [Polyangiales bacterium]